MRVVVAMRHRAARVGAVLALEAQGLAVEEAATAGAAVAHARERRPDVCVVDAALPGGPAAVAALAALPRAPRVVVVADHATVEDVIDALDAGASGYLLKDVAASRLAVAVADVARGELAIAPALVAELVEIVRALRPTRGDTHGSALTRREQQVLCLLRTGLTTKQVAQRLAVSPTTVRRHVSAAARKAGVTGRRAAIAGLESVQGRERE